MRKSFSLFLTVGLIVCARGEAFPIANSTCDPLASVPGNGPYMSLFTRPPGPGMNLDEWAHYDPSGDTLTIPGAADSDMRMTPAFGSGIVNDFNGTYSLTMNASSSFQSGGGTFSVFGAVPDLGIGSPSLLLSANVVAASVGPCNGSNTAMQLLMQVDYTNPSFGEWGDFVLLNGLLQGFVDEAGQLLNPTPDRENLFGGGKWIAGPPDYYDLYGSAQPVGIPEPDSAGLMLLGALATFGVIMFRRQRSV